MYMWKLSNQTFLTRLDKFLEVIAALEHDMTDLV